MLSVIETRLLTTGQVARMLNVHVNTVRRWDTVGILKAQRIGSRGDRRFSEDEARLLKASLCQPANKRR